MGKNLRSHYQKKCVQVHLLDHMKFLLRTLETRISFTDVYGHMRKKLKDEGMIGEHQLNVTINTEAREVLEKVIENDEYITTSFPHERLVMEYGERRVTASATETIYNGRVDRQPQSTVSQEKHCG